MIFSVKYAVIDSSRIRLRLVRNPAYNNRHVAFNNWCYIDFDPNHVRKPMFFEALKESVAREGFRNPIVVYAFPEGIMLSFGGSRLRTAHELNMPIPCIVVDFTGEFDACPAVNQESYKSYFADPPTHFVIDENGVDCHYSLERNRRQQFDAAGLAWVDLDNSEFIDKEFSWIDKDALREQRRLQRK